MAAQQNTTVQAVAGVAQVVTGPRDAARGGRGVPEHVQHHTDSSRLPISSCLGTTTVEWDDLPQGAEQALVQVFSLALAGIGLPSQQAVPATEQNTVDQMAYQWQMGQGAAGVQTQSASQINDDGAGRCLASAALQAAVGSSDPSAAGIINQTSRGFGSFRSAA